ncbi:hypothetical protein bAD24_p00865 (plasmid) [Burkholderia sp. AD24]|nr:hypothetical protein bAD24_p00865 [Burkholderia sp. AD24]
MKKIVLALALASVAVFVQPARADVAVDSAHWIEASKVSGVHDQQFIVAPHCEHGGIAKAEMTVEPPWPVSDMDYTLSEEGKGWRLLIVSARTGKRTVDSGRYAATVTAYCAR